jgi:hypothetical protein
VDWGIWCPACNAAYYDEIIEFAKIDIVTQRQMEKLTKMFEKHAGRNNKNIKKEEGIR